MNSIKILIIEDQPIIARDIEILLTKWGYQVIGKAESYDEAIVLFTEKKPDLALVDIRIDGALDGIETVNRFNAIRPIPIVYLTAHSDENTIKRAKQSYPVGYVLKPFDERSLQLNIEFALNIFTKQPQQIQQSITLSEDLPATLSARGRLDPSVSDPKLNSDLVLQTDTSVFIKHNYRFVKLEKRDLLFLEADHNHITIHTTQESYTIRMSLSAVLEKIEDNNIVKVHRSYAVNIQHIEEFNDSEIRIMGKTIPLSTTHKSNFLKLFKSK